MGDFYSDRASAATKVVSKWGIDDVSFGPGSAPCLSIGYAISLAAPNDTILVHPSVYSENLIINIEDLQLLSLSGRSATVILAADSSSHVVAVSANIVTVGSKVNGFLLQGGRDGVNVTLGFYANVKIEGNRASGNTDDGFQITVTWLREISLAE